MPPHLSSHPPSQACESLPVKTAQNLLVTIAAVIVCLLTLPAQAETFEETRAKAEQGDADVQNNLGVCYCNGESAAKNEAEAVKWFLFSPNSHS